MPQPPLKLQAARRHQPKRKHWPASCYFDGMNSKTGTNAKIQAGPNQPQIDVAFCATSRSGIGHLRRIASIARAIRQEAPQTELALITNATIAGLPEDDLALFCRRFVTDRAEMATLALRLSTKVFIADTMLPPGAMGGRCKCGLILREMPADRIERLQPEDGRPWDLVIVPNPSSHWMPSLPAAFTRSILTTGWIYRLPNVAKKNTGRMPQLLLATGGGGTHETALALAQTIGALVDSVRAAATTEFEVVQALGPRAGIEARIAQADRTIDPGGDLNQFFADADAVVSTSGYNSVLELAITSTPAVLVCIPRTLDDQTARARIWGPKIGRFFDGNNVEEVAAWLSGVLASLGRRSPVDIGPSGAPAAARAILELLR
jgi:hypothetical protein